MKHTQRISLSIDPGTLEKIDRYADTNTLARSTAVRVMCRNFLEGKHEQ